GEDNTVVDALSHLLINSSATIDAAPTLVDLMHDDDLVSACIGAVLPILSSLPVSGAAGLTHVEPIAATNIAVEFGITDNLLNEIKM
ncbi:hypothetical protein H0H87_007037, partial [Tephrocybe sp. NHM501043]